DQLGFRPHEDRADLEHPPARGPSERHAPRVAGHTPEFRVRERMGRGNVDDTLDVIAVDQPLNGADEVLVVDPRHELAAVTGPAAKAMARQREERVEYAARIRTQRHGRSKGNLPGSIGRGLLEGLFPRPRDVDAESPRAWGVRFAAAKNAGVLVV